MSFRLPYYSNLLNCFNDKIMEQCNISSYNMISKTVQQTTQPNIAHNLFIVKWVPAYMDRFEVDARGAYICFRSAGGKLIIVKHLWAYSYGKGAIKVYYFIFSRP